MREAQPKSCCRRELGVAAADPASAKKDENDNKHYGGGRGVPHQVGQAHSRQKCAYAATADQDQRYPIGDCHREKIARRRKRHYGRKERQTDRLNNEGHGAATPSAVSTRRGLSRRKLTAS